MAIKSLLRLSQDKIGAAAKFFGAITDPKWAVRIKKRRIAIEQEFSEQATCRPPNTR